MLTFHILFVIIGCDSILNLKGELFVLIGDLHMHSNNSDGSLDIEELVFIASKTGLDYISITDHNFINSKNKLLSLGEKYNIKIICGIELSCYDYSRKRKVHILCYNFKDPSVLQPICNETIQNRIEVGEEKAKYVKKRYIVSQNLLDKYRSKAGCLYNQNIVHALMECGYCDSIYGEVYDSLSSENLNIITKDDCDVRKMLELVHKSGGKAIVAHPKVYDSLDLLHELINEKLIDGVEVWHPKNSEDVKQILLSLVQKHNLIATGGTDFHGFYSSNRFRRIGEFTTPDESIKRLIK